MNKLTLDTDTHVYFYEQDFYVLSNFSSFQVKLGGISHQTSEHAYHYYKFNSNASTFYIAELIRKAKSAHDAFQIAANHKNVRYPEWDGVKEDYMMNILRAKVDQHEYVRRKLLETGDRILVENSWRDAVWGFGPNRDGQNLLGKCWMKIREEISK
jgi:ribA/ribD-fused uncharacterized protein